MRGARPGVALFEWASPNPAFNTRQVWGGRTSPTPAEQRPKKKEGKLVERKLAISAENRSILSLMGKPLQTLGILVLLLEFVRIFFFRMILEEFDLQQMQTFGLCCQFWPLFFTLYFLQLLPNFRFAAFDCFWQLLHTFAHISHLAFSFGSC